jgi:hypothetical protein
VASVVEPTTQAPPDAASVVQQFYDAIGSHNYQLAWQLGGSNLVSSYATFAAGFADTDRDQMTITASVGDTVDVQVTAYEYASDGSQQTSIYAGNYHVANGIITSGQLQLERRSAGW